MLEKVFPTMHGGIPLARLKPDSFVRVIRRGTDTDSPATGDMDCPCLVLRLGAMAVNHENLICIRSLFQRQELIRPRIGCGVTCGRSAASRPIHQASRNPRDLSRKIARRRRLIQRIQAEEVACIPPDPDAGLGGSS
ncbi:hypothetical protein NITHO_2790020 [Nitrolancea hollandica Lb]|uniref:Uncharacterized protein n=1 Tax=Nitrolancea hollandica Lb TaxID=1129897 RepID=I4EGP4_9BACT|nr:hypothetical protein NITHO_2790020 [Nitrolancea hollandica Lb]